MKGNFRVIDFQTRLAGFCHCPLIQAACFFIFSVQYFIIHVSFFDTNLGLGMWRQMAIWGGEMAIRVGKLLLFPKVRDSMLVNFHGNYL